MHSLKTKILGLISVIAVVIITTTACINFTLQKQIITSIIEHDALLLTETIKNSIANSMRNGRTDEVSNILSRIKSQESIKSVRIVDSQGKVLNSANPKEILPQAGSTPSPLPHMDRDFHLTNNMTSGEFVAQASIFNGPSCYGCHDSAKSVLGILQVELSLNYLVKHFDTLRTNLATTSIIMILLVILACSAFIIAYVDRPVNQLMHALQQLQLGNFDCKTYITSSREMALLSEQFNQATDKLHESITTSIAQERQLAKAQEKLSHHHEIQQMNVRLAEQLHEIENLNVSLEERIEEIEEANYKIADLAGELEDKNTTLESTVAKLSTLYKVGLGINATMEPDQLYDLIVKSTTESLNAQIGYLALYNAADSSLSIKNLRGHSIAQPCEPMSLAHFSVSRWVITNCKPLLITDISQHPQFPRFSALGFERKTMICAPLAVNDEIIGTLVVINRSEDSSFSNEDLELLTTIASQASIAIKNARLYDELQQTYLNTIQALISAVEASDSYTRGHSERVTRYCLSLARKLDLPASRIKILERAAVLHDVGKIGIDLTLLHKEGRLTPRDIDDLQQHPIIGMKILEPIEFLHDVKLCIGQHHERYDGKGYPNNIPGDQLLLESRILAIADSFDAMISDRPYRKALPVATAITELQAHAGTQFDPVLVPHFVAMIANGDFALIPDEFAFSAPAVSHA